MSTKPNDEKPNAVDQAKDYLPAEDIEGIERPDADASSEDFQKYAAERAGENPIAQMLAAVFGPPEVEQPPAMSQKQQRVHRDVSRWLRHNPTRPARILRYELNVGDGLQKIRVPVTAKLMEIGFRPQDPPEVISVWMQVLDHTLPHIGEMAYQVVGTGHSFSDTQFDNDDLTHIKSVVHPTGLVWHVFIGSRVLWPEDQE